MGGPLLNSILFPAISQPSKFNMNKEIILKKTKEYVRNILQDKESTHDWWHVHRVFKNAIKIARMEKADLFIVGLVSLLHDVGDWKFHDGDEMAGSRLARRWLKKLGLEKPIIDSVCTIIPEISFKGAGVKSKPMSKEGQIVQDADRLDAIGAIGIARAFAYGGYRKRLLHDPSQSAQKHKTFDEYKKSQGTTLNHFYEKLLLLKNRMNTKTGRRIAQTRHKMMLKFVHDFLREWRGSV